MKKNTIYRSSFVMRKFFVFMLLTLLLLSSCSTTRLAEDVEMADYTLAGDGRYLVSGSTEEVKGYLDVNINYGITPRLEVELSPEEQVKMIRLYTQDMREYYELNNVKDGVSKTEIGDENFDALHHILTVSPFLRFYYPLLDEEGKEYFTDDDSYDRAFTPLDVEELTSLIDKLRSFREEKTKLEFLKNYVIEDKLQELNSEVENEE